MMADIPYVKGAFRHILQPPGMRAAQAAGNPAQWYINDHCVFVDPAHRLHWFGITNPYPREGNYYAPGTHRHIGHASAASPWGPWEEHPHAFALPEGTRFGVGACFVAARGDEFFMMYGSDVRGDGLHTARSKDLFTWTLIEDNDLITSGQATRDPCILELGDGRYLLYVAGGHGGTGKISLASSRDLLHWEWLEPALMGDATVPPGMLESPFVHFHNGFFYLFVNHSHRQYEETIVFVSPDPFHFDWQQPVGTLFAHAAEIFGHNGRTYLTHCGIEDRHWTECGAPYGLWLAELDWLRGEA